MIVASNSCDDIPIIDMEGGDAVGAEILKAFSSIGFATLTNHGIPQSVIDSAFACSKAFFSLPLDQKMKRKYEGHASNRGYIPMGCEAFISENPEKKETLVKYRNLRHRYIVLTLCCITKKKKWLVV